MSSSSTPIHPHRFAEAIKDLPLSNLHLKAAEIRNSIEHLHSSNQQLQSFAAQGDHDCTEAIRENVEVMERMEERLIMLKVEVERRGYSWSDEEPRSVNGAVNGDMTVDVNGNEEAERRRTHRNTSRGAIDGSESTTPHDGGLGDDELRRLREQLDEVGDDRDGDGLHL